MMNPDWKPEINDKINQIRIKLGLARPADEHAKVYQPRNLIREHEKVQTLGQANSKANFKSTAKPIDPSEMRLFVRNLHPGTTEASLKNYFSRWGKVEDVFIRKPAQNYRGQNTCYMGYITFSSFFNGSPLNLELHIIEGMSVPIFKVQVFEKKHSEVVTESHTLMIIGTIQDLTESDLMEYFSKFGKIVRMIRKGDKKTPGKFERFAFLSFSDTRSVDKAIEKKSHVIKRQAVDVRRAKDIALRL